MQNRQAMRRLMEEAVAEVTGAQPDHARAVNIHHNFWRAGPLSPDCHLKGVPAQRHALHASGSDTRRQSSAASRWRFDYAEATMRCRFALCFSALPSWPVYL